MISLHCGCTVSPLFHRSAPTSLLASTRTSADPNRHNGQNNQYSVFPGGSFSCRDIMHTMLLLTSSWSCFISTECVSSRSKMCGAWRLREMCSPSLALSSPKNMLNCHLLICQVLDVFSFIMFGQLVLVATTLFLRDILPLQGWSACCHLV